MIAVPSEIPPEGRLIAQALSDGLDCLNDTLTRLSDSVCFPVPGNSAEATIRPAGWTALEESAWQQLCAQVDDDELTDLLIENHRALAHLESLLADP